MGALLTSTAWDEAARGQGFQLRASFLGPAFAVLGLALMTWPGYREERLARGEDLSSLAGLDLLTPRWWGVLIAMFVAGAAYSAALTRGWLAR